VFKLLFKEKIKLKLYKMELVTKLLYWLSTGLFIPLMIALLFYLVKSFVMIGSFYSLFVNRIKFKKSFNIVVEKVEEQSVIVLSETMAFKTNLGAHILELKKRQASKIKSEKVVANFELSCQQELGKAKTLAKMGPMMGLMGTLIPMGPALVGLAKGDIASLAENMQVAFATTVVGLFIGGIGFLLGQIKQGWFAEDLNDLQYINELIQ